MAESACEASINTTCIKQVVYSNIEEQVLSMLFIGIATTFTIIAQLLVLLTIIKSPNLHSPHFYIIGGYCCSDLLLVCITAPNYMTQFVTGEPNRLTCRILSNIGISIVLGATYHTALIACERYLFFCQPYRYSKYLSTGRVIAAILVCYTIPTIMGVSTEIQIGRYYHACILACNLPDSAVQSTVQFVVVLIPSAVITIFSLIKVRN